MHDLPVLAVHLLVTLAKLVRPGGVRAVAAESLLLKHQLLISNRSRKRAPNLTSMDRVVLGLTSLFVSPRRLWKFGAILNPATLFKFTRLWSTENTVRSFLSRRIPASPVRKDHPQS